MITRQVREVKNVEDEVRQMRRQLDNFDRQAHDLVLIMYLIYKILYGILLLTIKSKCYLKNEKNIIKSLIF